MLVNVHFELGLHSAPCAVLVAFGSVRVLLPPHLVPITGETPPQWWDATQPVGHRWLEELGVEAPVPLPRWALQGAVAVFGINSIMAGYSEDLSVPLDPPPVNTISPEDLAELHSEQGTMILGSLVGGPEFGIGGPWEWDDRVDRYFMVPPILHGPGMGPPIDRRLVRCWMHHTSGYPRRATTNKELYQDASNWAGMPQRYVDDSQAATRLIASLAELADEIGVKLWPAD